MSIWDNINISKHIKSQYKHIWAVNLDDVIVLKRRNLEAGNFFDEDEVENIIRYPMKLNINPVKEKELDISEKGVAKNIAFDCYSNPEEYPTTGLDENNNVINEPFTGFQVHDKIEYKGRVYEVKNFESVSFNNKPTLWENFRMHLIN